MTPFQNCKIVGANIDSTKYHAEKGKRGDPSFVMSPSSLKAFSTCPERWVKGYESPQTDAKDWGNALDVMVLTPELVKERLAMRPATYPHQSSKSAPIEQKEWHGGSTWCKQWIKDHEHMQVVSPYEAMNLSEAKARINEDATIKSFLDASDKQVQVTGEYHDDSTGVVVPVQCLIDVVPRINSEYRTALGDLKSTRSANQRAFTRYMYQNGYHVQAAFDLAMFNAATGEQRNKWILILSENYKPWQTGRRILVPDNVDPARDEGLLGIGQSSFMRGLRRYAKCLKTGKWDSYDPDEEWSEVIAEPWMAFEEAQQMSEFNYEDAQEENEEVIP